MRLSQFIERQPKKRRSSRAPGSIATHHVFVPMITAWGAALAGLSLAVLPAVLTARIMMITNLGFLGGSAKWAFAGIAAVLGGALAWMIARALRSRALEGSETITVASAFAKHRVRPINPAAELGSDSLDAPLEKMPFHAQAGNGDGDANGQEQDAPGEAPSRAGRGPTLGELAQRGYDMDAPDKSSDTGDSTDRSEWRFTRRDFQSALIETCEGATCEAAASPQDEPAMPTPPSGSQPAERGAEEAHEGAHERAGTMAEVKIKAPAQADARKAAGRIGAAGATQSWSLTQFRPPVRSNTATPPQSAAQPSSDASVPQQQPPRELDLGEFAQLPNRNAVWVTGEEADRSSAESPAPTAAPAPVPAHSPTRPTQPPHASLPAQGALEKLRRKPPENLSLVEMVERFAAALHERQQAERSRGPQAAPGRDAALAEALKALTLFTERGFDRGSDDASTPAELSETERELRDALAKLQSLRGAA